MMPGTPPRDETLNRLHDIVFDKVSTVLRGPEAAPFDLFFDWLDRLNSELDQPLRMSATTPSTTGLLIKSNKIIAGDGGGKESPPIDDVLNEYPDTIIDFGTQSVSGTGTVTTAGSAFSLPVVTVGEFVRMAAVYQSEANVVDILFSDAVATSGLLANPGDLFSSLDGLPMGYADLESTGVSSFKSISSGGNIENAVNGDPLIHRFASGAGGGGALSDFSVKTITGNVAKIGKGTQKLMGGVILITGTGTTQATLPINLDINLDTIFGSGPAASTSYYLYVDKYSLETPITLSDTGREVIRVQDETNFALLTTSPEDTNPFRYLPVGHIFSGSDSTWSGAGSNKETTAVLRESFGAREFNQMQTASDVATTASGSITFSHGFGTVPDLVEFFYYDGSKTTEVDGSSHLLNITDSIVEYSSLGKTFGGGETLTCKAFRVQPPGLHTASILTDRNFGPYTDTSVASVVHGLSAGEDIRGMTLLENDITSGLRHARDHTELVSGYDDTNIYFDWTALSPSSNRQYTLAVGGTPIPTSVPIHIGGFTKLVGYGPGSYQTLTEALAGSSSGDSILIGRGYVITAQEVISLDDIRVKCMPGVIIDVDSAIAESAWKITGNRVDLQGLNMRIGFSGTQTAALRIEGDDCNISESRIETDDAGVTLTDGFLIHSTADRAYVNGSVRATAGTVTTTFTDNGADTGVDIRG